MANDHNEVGIFASDHNMYYHGLLVLFGKDLFSNVVLTLQEAREHAKRCKDILYNQNLSMQSYLDVLFKKLNIHQGDLDILIKSGVLKESSNAIVVLRLVTEGSIDFIGPSKREGLHFTSTTSLRGRQEYHRWDGWRGRYSILSSFVGFNYCNYQRIIDNCGFDSLRVRGLEGLSCWRGC